MTLARLKDRTMGEPPPRADWRGAVASLKASQALEAQDSATPVTWDEPVGGLLHGRNISPTRAAVLMIAGAFGVLRPSAMGLHDGARALPYEVRSRNGGEGAPDGRGILTLSSTNKAMQLHTDGYAATRPPAYVALMCVRAGSGGRFGVTRVDDLVADLPRWVCDLLMESVYPIEGGKAPLLWRTRSDDEYAARINVHDVWSYLEQPGSKFTLPLAHRRAVRRLETVLAASTPAWREQLRAGDVVVLDNTALVHGRSAIGRDGERLLYRVWVGAAEPVGIELFPE